METYKLEGMMRSHFEHLMFEVLSDIKARGLDIGQLSHATDELVAGLQAVHKHGFYEGRSAMKTQMHAHVYCAPAYRFETNPEKPTAYGWFNRMGVARGRSVGPDLSMKRKISTSSTPADQAWETARFHFPNERRSFTLDDLVRNIVVKVSDSAIAAPEGKVKIAETAKQSVVDAYNAGYVAGREHGRDEERNGSKPLSNPEVPNVVMERAVYGILQAALAARKGNVSERELVNEIRHQIRSAYKSAVMNMLGFDGPCIRSSSVYDRDRLYDMLIWALNRINGMPEVILTAVREKAKEIAGADK